MVSEDRVMRTFGAPLFHKIRFGTPLDLSAKIPAPGPLVRRRLSDSLQTILTRACNENEVEVAVDLLNVLEKWSSQKPGRTSHSLQEARREVARLKRRVVSESFTESNRS